MKRTPSTIGLALAVASLTALPAAALSTPNSLAASTTSADQAQLQLIINRGNNEISRRLSTLQGLTTKITSATKLSASDQASLSDEVTSEVTGLTSLKAKLDADTTVAAARTDAQSIITGYRVYAFIVPKIGLVKAADDQQVAESKLTALVPKLQSRVDAAKAAGKNVTSLASGLTDMSTQISNAQGILPSVSASIISLQPSDFNTNHKVLSDYRDKLKTAQTDIRAAVTDANSIVNALKNL
jgi:hypothetical protein